MKDVDRALSPTYAAAAGNLAERLEGLAAELAWTASPVRYAYGTGRVRSAFRRRSPEGFSVGTRDLKLLLPDGRLWSYSRSDAPRYPEGRFYDARSDFVDYATARTSPAGTSFTFLGAAIGKYTFGLVEYTEPAAFSGLASLVADKGPVHFVDPDEAFADLAATFGSRLEPARIAG